MVINRLTERAKILLLSLAKDRQVEAGTVMKAIYVSTGLGATILNTTKKLRIDKARLIDVNRLVEEAYFQSASLQHPYVGTEHLLLALLRLISSPDAEIIKDEISKSNTFQKSIKPYDSTKHSPILEAFGINLNKKFIGNYKAPVYRKEVNNLISVLLQKDSPNPIVVGEPGVGKETLIEILVHKINSLDVPPSLLNYNVVEFDLLAFIASLSNKDSLEFALAAFVEEVARMGNTIIFIKNFQNLFIATNMGLTVPLAFSMLKSDFRSIGVRLVAVMSASLYDRVLLENEHILQNFTIVNLEEPSKDSTLKFLENRISDLSIHHNIKIPPEIIDYVYTKAKNDLKDKKFPQKGLELLDRACSKLLLKKSVVSKSYKNLVVKKLMYEQQIDLNMEKGNYSSAYDFRKRLLKIEHKIGSAEKDMFSGQPLVLTNLEIDEAVNEFGYDGVTHIGVDLESLGTLAERIKQKIIGQDEAVDIVAKSLVRSKLGLRSRKRPLGNFLLLGPTGVGKTELAKVLAMSAFGDNSLIRLDMSDFGEKHTIARLVGAPPGYVGYGEGGELTSKIEEKPDSVVLFDEIEKAHPDVLNILLQIMEEGELSDARGNTYDFSSSVVILTSNLGTDLLRKEDIGFEKSENNENKVEAKLKNNLKKILKPELLNRFDEIIIFKKLKQVEQMKILNLLISEVHEALKKQKITLKMNIKVKKLLLTSGYSDEYGARSLRRVVEKELLDRIAEILLKNTHRPLSLLATVKENSILIHSQ